MGLFIARISGGALGVLFTVLAFVLQVFIRRGKVPLVALRVFSAAGVAGSIYIIFITVQNLLRYAGGVSSIVTVSAPFLAFVVALTIHFFVILLSLPKVRGKGLLNSVLVTALLASLQGAFALFNLMRKWNNLTRGGMKEYLYIQLLALAFIIIDILLFWINFRKMQSFIRTATAAV